jgi:Cu-Zn family superoxide dismutase
MKLSRLVAVWQVPLLIACAGGQTEPAEPEPAPVEAPAAPEPTAAPEPEPEPQAEAEPAPPIRVSVDVELQAKSGSKLAGKAKLSEVEGGVAVVIDVENVKPGDHGAHIHEKADCSAKDAKSAGDHYNPDKHEHGLPDKEQRHLGDLGNISVGKDGKGHLEITIPGANLRTEDAHSFVGRAIIIHEKKDDGKQPVGNAGGRIGCGEIKP